MKSETEMNCRVIYDNQLQVAIAKLFWRACQYQENPESRKPITQQKKNRLRLIIQVLVIIPVGIN
jgi:hypothetical protein